MTDIQGAIDEIQSKRAEFLKMVTTGDYSTANAVELRFADAVMLYGSYATPLTARLGHSKALATTHYWLEAGVRDSVDNAQAEGDTPTTREKIPERKSNTCQIVSGLVDVSGSAVQEAANGMYGSATDLLQFQAEAEMQGIIKDIERAALLGTESTSDPRAMKGLKAWLTTNQEDVGGLSLGTANIEDLLTAISNQKTGHLPTALYAPAEVMTAMSKWANNRVQGARYSPIGRRDSRGAVRDLAPRSAAANPTIAAIRSQVRWPDLVGDRELTMALTELDCNAIMRMAHCESPRPTEWDAVTIAEHTASTSPALCLASGGDRGDNSDEGCAVRKTEYHRSKRTALRVRPVPQSARVSPREPIACIDAVLLHLRGLPPTTNDYACGGGGA